MSFSQRIIAVWTSSIYPAPKVPLIFYEGEYMATVDDSDNFLRFMSAGGQIFLALNTNCQYGKPDPAIGDVVYMCSKVDPILCSPTRGPNSNKDIFVLKNIAPLLA